MLKSPIPVNGFYVSTENNFPGFLNPFIFDFRLDTTANARDIEQVMDIGVSIDLLGNVRDTSPDLGAYEFIEE